MGLKFKILMSLFVNFCLMVTLSNAQMMGQWGDPGWGHEERHHMDWPDTLNTTEVTGTVLVDSSFYMPHYYLDVDGNEEVDYQLGFGPYWYEPESGALRPDEGELITVKGWVQTSMLPQMLVVLELNGLMWRETSGVPGWSGMWIHGDSEDHEFVYCPTDSLSWLNFQPGSFMGGGMHGGMMFPDSIYVQFELMHPDSLPGFPDSTCFAGFHLNTLDDRWGDMMGGFRGGRHSMGFRQNVGFQFHFTEEMLQARGLEENHGVHVRYYDPNSGWMTMPDYSYDPESNMIDFSTATTSSYYGLFTTSSTTDVEENQTAVPTGFVLKQNYPNPFNPTTTITFTIPDKDFVEMKIYDVLGKEVRTLVSSTVDIGNHTVRWDGLDNSGMQVRSGVYFYKITTNGYSQIRQMVLLR